MTVEAPKPPRRNSTKGDAPASPIAAAALVKAGHTHQAAPEDLVTANFKVEAAFRHDMKMFAAMHKMSMVAVLREGFALLKASKQAPK
ncbi:hypothetical protein FGA82_17880 [Pseudomonas fluorescens]|uniref:hypothetical protein n=1 Tax=Pseudomonas fluorescens TaxID=294 RepID=UPI00113162C3|nr:hypothetical protein [Pseudomonas fluorescens]TMU77493.1 hypothetical protein FGA82_17880 [Pseudomonas fluorescens]